MFFIRDKQIYNRGFTLLEMLVAVLIFSFALVTLMTVSSRGVVTTQTAVDQNTAQFLAQEGIEMIQAIRDGNLLDVSGSDWLDGLNACVAPGFCRVGALQNGGVNDLSVIGCTTGGCPALSYDQNRAAYFYEDELSSLGASETRFIREIQLQPIGVGDDEHYLLVSIVRWARGGVERSVVQSKELTRWFQQSL